MFIISWKETHLQRVKAVQITDSNFLKYNWDIFQVY